MSRRQRDLLSDGRQSAGWCRLHRVHQHLRSALQFKRGLRERFVLYPQSKLGAARWFAAR
jgi:hypothetical protein